MRSLLFLAVLLTTNLSLLMEFAAALPDYFPPNPRTDITCKPPPTPKIRSIDYANLNKITGPKLPHINGTIRLGGFKPKGSRTVFNPKVIPFFDPHAPMLEKIAPNATLMFMRKQVDFSDQLNYPYNLMGKVIMRNGPRPYMCTGTLIGTRIFITANHCVANRTDGWSLEYIPAFDGTKVGQIPDHQPWGKPIFSKECVGIPDGIAVDAANPLNGRDYVACRLEKSLPDIGYFGANVRFNDDEYKGQTWLSAGYPADFLDGQVLTLEDKVIINDVEDSTDSGKALIANPYVDHGWSGGPLFGKQATDDGDELAFLIGVVSATVKVCVRDSMFDSTIHSGGYRMALLMQHARCLWGVTPDELTNCKMAKAS